MTFDERIKKHLGQSPQIHETAYIAEGASIIGDVTIGADSSVWPSSVLRGDINSIKIGEGSNIQDGTVVHLADDYGVEIGDYVTVGHLAMVHACTIENECLIGMHATILDGAVIGERSIIGAGAVVKQGMIVPPGSMVLGLPGRIVKTLDLEAQKALRGWAEKYIKVSRAHRRQVQ